MKVVVSGAAGPEDIPAFDSVAAEADVVFAPDGPALQQAVAGAEIVLGWDFRGRDMEEAWPAADSLKWIQWCGAGVDAVLFPALAESSVLVTNVRGLFDRAMAESVLCYMLAEVKDFRRTVQDQQDKVWNHRLTGKLAGQSAVVIGTGSIGRETAELLKAVGLRVSGVGRTARQDDPCFGTIHASGDAAKAASAADWVIAVLPGTPETESFFTAEFFTSMRPSARFVNIGRGNAVDEAALVAALESGAIAGAMLDVFRTEPLPQDSPMWRAPNLVVTPHMTGDYHGYHADMIAVFVNNLKRYKRGEGLINIVDKQLGYVPNETTARS